MEGFNVVKLTGPSWLAAWLVGGDWNSDGLTPAHRDKVRQELRKHGLSVVDCVDCKEEGFLKTPDFGEAGDCSTYIFHQPHGDN